MSPRPALRVAVAERSQVGEARRTAVALATRAELAQERIDEVALLATELSTNLLAHGEGGELVLASPGPGRLDLLALDNGPGIRDIATAMRDGQSTSDTPGLGLGAIRRLSDAWDVFSRPARGAAVLARIGTTAAEEGAVRVGALGFAYPGQDVSGDAAFTGPLEGGGTRVAVFDGLGHGPAACDAAQAAVATLGACAALGPAAALDAVDRALGDTRGAAGSVVDLDPVGGGLVFAGVGNVTAAVVDGPKVHRLVNVHGTLGQGVRRQREAREAWPRRAVLVLHTDGLEPDWRLDDHPGLASRDPVLIAGVLLRGHAGARRDDVTVAVARRA